MNASFVFALTLLLSGCAQSTAETAQPLASETPADTVRTDWGAHFDAAGARGTFVMLETATGRVSRYNPERAATRFTPASTSKVFNALVFLDQGVVRDVDSVIVWDGLERWLPAWNQDHTLRSGTRVSAVWLFQRLALEVGRDGYEDVFSRQPYGNSVMGEDLHMAWLDGSLQISADEQIVFMDGLRRGTLGFSPEAQAATRDILPELASGDGWRLLAKTGWGVHEGQDDIGWLVGWVERASGARGGDVVFALNAEQAGEGTEWDMGPGRLALTRAILDAEGVTG